MSHSPAPARSSNTASGSSAAGGRSRAARRAHWAEQAILGLRIARHDARAPGEAEVAAQDGFAGAVARCLAKVGHVGESDAVDLVGNEDPGADSSVCTR